ncbi:MAG: glycoside hydrolase family 140 protein [Sedimentisphaerales bacterium]|nr:glycoside hydrolase family 140 protein [Sedimentisphaerales bacterium]
MRFFEKANVIFAVCLLASFAFDPAPGVAGASQRLRVAANHRYLEYADGTPFFYLGDTAWELFHRLNREEADRYLADRARKGFTVIQAVVLAQLGGLTDPNPYGDTPLIEKDPTRPNEAYFQHVDYIVEKAGELGLFIGMLPTWGSYWKSGLFDERSAASYGRFLGKRYKDDAIIWILGGDENIKNEREAKIVGAMARGLREGDSGAHLITYHPRGPGLSSDYFHRADWLDFNMFQSSHAARDHDNALFTEHDYALKPPKPTLDGEPRYETIPVGFYNSDATDTLRFDAYDARQAAYWSLMAGACGHTYGHNSIWQMWQEGRTPVISAAVPWHESLDHPGAFQMGYVRKLFESRPFPKLVPDQSMLADAPGTGGAKVRAARAADGSFAFIYSPRGRPFAVRMSAIRASRVKATWFDPRYGIAEPLHTSDNVGFQTFVPPTSGRGCDWLLVLDDAGASFPSPGSSKK